MTTEKPSPQPVAAAAQAAPEKACKFDQSLPDVPLLQEQAAAWFLVADTLTEVAEWWHDLEGSGMEKAAQAIRKLASIQAPEGGHAAAMRQALAALENSSPHNNGAGWIKKHHAAKRALQDALAAQPQAPVGLAQEQWPPTPSAYQGDQYIGYSRTDLLKYAQEVLTAHGITQTKEPTNDR